MSTPIEIAASPREEGVAGGISEVAVLAYPVVLQTLSDTMMQVVDSAIVGRLGMIELGGVGFGGVWLWTMLVMFVGASTGVQTFVSQEFGSGKAQRCGPWAWQGLYAVLLPATIWVIIVALLYGPFLAVLGPSPELRERATSYALMRLLGAPALVAAVVFTSFFRGIGDTRTPLLAAVFANILNAIVAYSLVLGRFGMPAWGVAGAGLATAGANWVYCGILVAALLRGRTAKAYATCPVRPDVNAMRRFIRTSAPIGGQWLLDMCSFALFSTIIARMGNAQMAASQAMIQLLSLSFMQAFGISIASGALVGRYVGARDPESAARSHRSAMKLGMLLAVLVALLFWAIPDTLLSVFTNDPEVIRLGRPLLLLGAVFQLVDAAGIIAGGSLRGAGDTRWPFVVQASLAWLVRLPLVYLVAIVWHGGVVGAWCGELGYVAVLGATWMLRFRGGAWRAVRI